MTGTPFYCPPEVWKDKPYSEKCDIWSLGCVIYELTRLHPPFQAKNIEELKIKVKKGEYPKIPKHFSDDLQSIIDQCLIQDPTKRSSAHQLLQMRPFCNDDPTSSK